MSKLFIKQAKLYADARPTYPKELFQLIASKTPCHDLVWDVGTGSGQAIPPLAEVYKNVIGTDTSPTQLDFAPKLPNVKYHHTPPTMSISEFEQNLSIHKSTVDLVTIAQALHWLDLPIFYEQVKWALKKPNGVIAAWCYTIPKFTEDVDAVFSPFYAHSRPYWEEARKIVDDKFQNIYFPFEPVDGLDNTGPYEFNSEKKMSLENFFTYIRSWSAYNTAKEKGVELLDNDVVDKFTKAWNNDGISEKIAMFPVYLRIGKVGDMD